MKENISSATATTGIVILAGGKSSRMGGHNKALCMLNGKTLLSHILERVQLQSSSILLNANDQSVNWEAYGLPVQTDTIADFPGPLGGILTAMEWFSHNHPHLTDIVSIPTDSPFIPKDLIVQLLTARERARSILATAFSAGRAHPAIGLWPLQLQPDLKKALIEEHIHRIIRFTERYSLALAEYKTSPIDPFLNINTPDELAKAEEFMRKAPLI